MMERTELFEKDSIGYYYALSNKKTNGIMYSKIDRVIGNVD